MFLTEHAITSMGFRKFEGKLEVGAEFYLLLAYKLEGLALPHDEIAVKKGNIGNKKFSIGIGKSINNICKYLIKDDFVDSEETWLKENNLAPPFAIILMGPTSPYDAEYGYIKNEKETVHTYDTFNSAKEELSEFQKAILPKALTAIRTAFNKINYNVVPVIIHKEIFAITKHGNKLIDFQITGSASATHSRSLPHPEVLHCLEEICERVKTLNSNVAMQFRLGQEENDPFKKFLYHFLSVEISINNKRILIAKTIRDVAENIIDVKFRSEQYINYLASKIVNSDSIFEKAVLCSLADNKFLSKDDLKTLKTIIDVRNGIAHGKVSAVPPAAIANAESLALKVLG